MYNFSKQLKFSLSRLLVLCLLIIVSASLTHANNEPLTPLTILSEANIEHKFQVELAISQAEKNKGLMYRQVLPRNQGMLFLYDEPKIVEMWMKNTYIPLDIVFIDDKGNIINIAKNTQPHSLKVIASHSAAIAALELNAGTTSELSIQKGDKVLHNQLPIN